MCIVIKNHTERKRRNKRYRSEEQASHVIKGSPGHAMPTTTLLENTHPPSFFACCCLRSWLAFNIPMCVCVYFLYVFCGMTSTRIKYLSSRKIKHFLGELQETKGRSFETTNESHNNDVIRILFFILLCCFRMTWFVLLWGGKNLRNGERRRLCHDQRVPTPRELRRRESFLCVSPTHSWSSFIIYSPCIYDQFWVDQIVFSFFVFPGSHANVVVVVAFISPARIDG